MAVTIDSFLNEAKTLNYLGEGARGLPNDLNIHCIEARTGLRLKRVKMMMYALNHQVFDKPV